MFMASNQIIVSQEGSGYRTLQEAVLSIDDSHLETVTISVKPGIYEEKVFIRKENIRIIGEDSLTTIFRYGDGARKLREDGSGKYGTFNTAVIFFAGSNIEVKNITIENTAGSGHIAGQALATYVAADRIFFYNCRFLGFQDTIFTGEAQSCTMKNLMLPEYFSNSKVKIDFTVNRNYFKNCYICGNVDFIFGPNTAFFDHCDIVTRKDSGEPGGYITAASTSQEQEYGYVFYRCHLMGEKGTEGVYLGRPWRDYAMTVFVQCVMEEHIHPDGWHNWGRPKAEVTTSYVEIGNTGAGARTDERIPFSKQLINPELLDYFHRERVLAGTDNWKPL